MTGGATLKHPDAGIFSYIKQIMDNNMKNRRLNPSSSDSDYYFLTRARTVLENVISRHIPDHDKLSILDYGCGDVPYRSLFSDSCNYQAADIPGNKHANMIMDNSGAIPADDSFDVVLSIQVLEHVPDYTFYLQEANRVLKPGGLLFISTHGWWTHHPFPNDYWRWTREGLEKIIDESSFEIIDSDWIISMLAYSCQLRIQTLKGVLENKGKLVNYLLLKPVSAVYQQMMRFYDYITPENIGRSNASIFFFVAKKKGK